MCVLGVPVCSGHSHHPSRAIPSAPKAALSHEKKHGEHVIWAVQGLTSMPVSHRHPSNARPVEAVPSDRLLGLFGKGRRCTHEGCVTVLNSFHPGHRCYVHEAPRFIRGSGSREQQASIEDFQELLEEVA